MVKPTYSPKLRLIISVLRYELDSPFTTVPTP